MAGSSTPRGAAADAQAEQAGGTPEVEVSDSGVTVATAEDPSKFEPVTLYKGDDTREATSPSEVYSLKFDGFSTKKPKKS